MHAVQTLHVTLHMGVTLHGVLSWTPLAKQFPHSIRILASHFCLLTLWCCPSLCIHRQCGGPVSAERLSTCGLIRLQSSFDVESLGNN